MNYKLDDIFLQIMIDREIYGSGFIKVTVDKQVPRVERLDPRSMMAWFGDDEETDEEALLREFEKMINEPEEKTPPPFTKKQFQNECKHKWINTGVNPNTGEHWQDCKHCSMKKEDYERKSNRS